MLCIYLPEVQFAIQVFIHLFDHILQAHVSLWSTELLHHQLQLHQVNEVILLRVISTNIQQC